MTRLRYLRPRLRIVFAAAATAAALTGARASAAAADEREERSAKGSRPVPGFDTFEHRFGLALGAARAAQLGLGVTTWRLDYTLAWQGWGVGIGVSSSLAVDRLTIAGIQLRRGMLLGPGRLCAALELGIARLQQGYQGDREAALYHGTSSALELSYELGRETTLRPFLTVRADLPWHTTEIETLTPVMGAGGAGELTAIGYRRQWTPLFGAWLGIAL